VEPNRITVLNSWYLYVGPIVDEDEQYQVVARATCFGFEDRDRFMKGNKLFGEKRTTLMRACRQLRNEVLPITPVYVPFRYPNILRLLYKQESDGDVKCTWGPSPEFLCVQELRLLATRIRWKTTLVSTNMTSGR
jgi:hypothetical protein